MHLHKVRCWFIHSLLIIINPSNFLFDRISLSDNNYRVIKPPQGIETCRIPQLHLGKSEKGIYCALLDYNNRLRVWTLGGSSCDQSEWIWNHYSSFRPVTLLPRLNCAQQVHDPWILHNSKSHDNEAWKEEFDFQWDSEEGNTLHTGHYPMEGSCDKYIEILGFHPYKEIIFLHSSRGRGLAYHLDSSKLEDFGNMRPHNLSEINSYIETCFPYTPCWIGIGEFPDHSKV